MNKAFVINPLSPVERGLGREVNRNLSLALSTGEGTTSSQQRASG
jgi:hypothetical protein